MEALEIFAYFAGTACVIGAFAFLLKIIKQPTITVYTDTKSPSREERLRGLGLKRDDPMWTYEKKTTTTTYAPKAKAPKGEITTEPPHGMYTSSPKEKN